MRQIAKGKAVAKENEIALSLGNGLGKSAVKRFKLKQVVRKRLSVQRRVIRRKLAQHAA